MMNSRTIANIIVGFMLVLALRVVVLPDDDPAMPNAPEAVATQTASGAPDNRRSLVITDTLRQELSAKALRTVRVYGSFPNPEGAEASLGQLKAMVSPEYLRQISDLWQGADLTTVQLKITDASVGEVRLSPSGQTALVDVIAVQQATFIETPQQRYFIDYTVEFEPRSDAWLVIHIYEA